MNWIQQHWIEIIGFVSGFVFIFLEIKENKWMWPVGFLSALFYIIVFFQTKFYADMSLQFYYLAVSVYGWHIWTKGKKEEDKIAVSSSTFRQFVLLFVASFLLFILFSYILKTYTDSPVPYWDSLTTALSITATWMLAKKIIEQWFVWIFVDLLSAVLYIYKDLYLTSLLYFIFAILAVIGYLQWKKTMCRI
jgi:nicotinamide mononucleotide transporter